MGWAGNLFKWGGKALKWGAPAALAPVTGGASLALYGVYGQQQANAQNKELAREQMQFQERMRDTEVQARVQDLIKAGLNPALAYQQSASSPTGQTAQIENALAGAASTASGIRLQREQVQNLRATNENIDADTSIKRETARGIAMDNLLKQVDTSATSLNARQRIRHFESVRLEKEIESIISGFQLTDEQRKQVQGLTQHIINEKEAQAQLARLGISEAEANAALWETVEEWGKGAGLASKVLQGLKVIIFRNKSK